EDCGQVHDGERAPAHLLELLADQAPFRRPADRRAEGIPAEKRNPTHGVEEGHQAGRQRRAPAPRGRAQRLRTDHVGFISAGGEGVKSATVLMRAAEPTPCAASSITRGKTQRLTTSGKREYVTR